MTTLEKGRPKRTKRTYISIIFYISDTGFGVSYMASLLSSIKKYLETCLRRGMEKGRENINGKQTVREKVDKGEKINTLSYYLKQKEQIETEVDLHCQLLSGGQRG